MFLTDPDRQNALVTEARRARRRRLCDPKPEPRWAVVLDHVVAWLGLVLAIYLTVSLIMGWWL